MHAPVFEAGYVSDLSGVVPIYTQLTPLYVSVKRGMMSRPCFSINMYATLRTVESNQTVASVVQASSAIVAVPAWLA